MANWNGGTWPRICRPFSFVPSAHVRGARGAVLVFVLALLTCAGTGCRAEPWPLWESYSARFLDDQGRVIDHGANDVTTTEGEAYAMFFALVTNDRARFVKLLGWTEANLAGGDLTVRLPAWSWGKASDGSWRVLDSNSAGDADLWMAYTLCEAGRLWRIDRFSRLGEVLASRVAQQEIVSVDGLGATLLPGSAGFHPHPESWYLNPSYMPPMLLAYFAHTQPQTPWNEALTSLPALVSTRGGFAMDWVRVENGAVLPSPTPAAAQEGSKDAAPLGSYDAIRVYLWLGISDPRTHGVRESLDRLHGMAQYLKAQVTPPLSVDSDGRVVNADAPPGFSAAVIPYLRALNLRSLETAQMDRLLATKDASTGLFGRSPTYYDQNLALFATGWSEGRFRFESDGRLHTAWK